MANYSWISGTEASNLLGVARNKVLRMRGVETRYKGRGFQVKRATLPLRKLTLTTKKGKRG